MDRVGGVAARSRTAAGCALLLAACAAAGCAGPDEERNLAPLFSRHSAAGGGAEIEALGGMLLTRRDPVTADRSYWAVRPLLSSRTERDGSRFAWFLPPFGFLQEDTEARTTVAQLLPIARYASRRLDSGFLTWTLLVIPGVYWAGREDGSVQRAVFPFGGVLEDFLSVDRATFVLFPLWLRIERHGRTTDHVLWPFFTWARGAGGTAWRAWPLVGHNRWEGRYSRRFALWPFLHLQHNDQILPPDEQQHSWLVWPLVGRSRRGDARSTTVLWPFFGYAHDPESGFWAWDGPWPLVVFQGGDPERARRERVWPFYSRYEGDGLVQYWHPWPIVNRRYETYDDGTRRTFNVFPFWRCYDRVAAEGTTRWRKLWPLFRWRSGPGDFLLTFPDPNPFFQMGWLDEHFAWLWELYARRVDGDRVRSRSWLGLWRRERDRDEDRCALGPLWAARSYSRAGDRVEERSYLFGLIRTRWREGHGLGLLRPAIPGPGWPLERVPSSLPLDTDVPR